MKILITSSAFQRYVLKQKLIDKSEQVVNYLIKIFLYPSNSAAEHWKHEVYSFLYQVGVLKSSNTFPTSKFILNCTWNTWEDAILTYIPIVMQDFSDVSESSPKYVYRAIHDYFLWLSKNLSMCGRVSQTSVKQAINDLVTIYNFV